LSVGPALIEALDAVISIKTGTIGCPLLVSVGSTVIDDLCEKTSCSHNRFYLSEMFVLCGEFKRMFTS